MNQVSKPTNSPNAAPARPASILVIDPKRELRKHVFEFLTDMGDPSRLVLIDTNTILDFFEGQDDLPLMSKMAKLGAIAPPAWSKPGPGAATWVAMAKSFLEKIVRFDALGREKGGHPLREVLNHLDPQETQPSYFAVLQRLLNFARASRENLQLANQAILDSAKQYGIPEAAATFFQSFLADPDLIAQFNYFCMEADIFLDAVANPDVTRLIDFCPFGPESSSITPLLPLVEDGKVIVFSPSLLSDATVTIVGKCLKTKFFQSVFSRDDKTRPVGYVCDECQRFITCDEDSGEQSFLDRCRAYRTTCILATQSIAAIQYALSDAPGADQAVDIILNNTGNKILMRNTDDSTSRRLHALIPDSPYGGPHIADIRPMTTLGRGEAYYLLCNGEWGRETIKLPTHDVPRGDYHAL